jgi:hypothetical protein
MESARSANMSNSKARNTRIHQTHATVTPTAHDATINPQQHTSYFTPREDGHVPNRCSCKNMSRHAELSRRPSPLRSCNAAGSAHHQNCNGGMQQAPRATWAARGCGRRLRACAGRCNRGGGGDGGTSGHDEPSRPKCRWGLLCRKYLSTD